MPATQNDLSNVIGAFRDIIGNPAEENKMRLNVQTLQGRQGLADLLSGGGISMGADGMPQINPQMVGRMLGQGVLGGGPEMFHSMVSGLTSIPMAGSQIQASKAAADNSRANTALHQQEFDYKKSENERKQAATNRFGQSLRSGGLTYDSANQVYRVNPQSAAEIFADAVESGQGQQFGSFLHGVNQAGVSAAEAAKAATAAAKERRIYEGAETVNNLFRSGAIVRNPYNNVLEPAAGREGDVLAAVVSAGMGPDLKAAMSAINEAALQDQKIKMEAQESWNRRPTKTEAEGGAIERSGLSAAQIASATLFPPVSLAPGSTAMFAPGDPRTTQAIDAANANFAQSATPPAQTGGIADAFTGPQAPQAPAQSVVPQAPTIGPAQPIQQGGKAAASGIVQSGNSVTNVKGMQPPEKTLDQISRSISAIQQANLAIRAITQRPDAVGGVMDYIAPKLGVALSGPADAEVKGALQSAAAAKAHELYGGAYTENEKLQSSGFIPDTGFGAEKNADRLRFMANESSMKLRSLLASLPQGYQLPPEIAQQIQQSLAFPESPLLGAFSGMANSSPMPVLPRPDVKNQRLDAKNAAEFLKAAGGDKDKARELARKQGFLLQ